MPIKHPFRQDALTPQMIEPREYCGFKSDKNKRVKERKKERKHTKLFAVDPHFIILIYIFENNRETASEQEIMLKMDLLGLARGSI